MATAKSMKSIFRKAGITITVCKNGEPFSTFNAFLQPLRYKNKIYLRGVATELGFDSLKKYLLISPPDISLSEIDGADMTLRLGSNHLSIDHSEIVYFGKEPFYTWSIVSKEE